MGNGNKRNGLILVAWILCALLLALASLFYFSHKSQSVYQAGYYDLNIFKQAAVRYWQGEPVYQRSDDLADRYKPGAIVYKFPPPYLLNFIPWFDATGQEFPEFRARFTMAYIAIYALSIVIICSLILRCRDAINVVGIDRESLVFILLAVAFSAAYLPYFVVQGGTSGESYIMAFALLAFICMRRYPWLAGFLLIWLAAIKIYPVFLLLYPLLTRQWKVLLSACIYVPGIALLSVAVFGIQENLFYLQKILPLLLSEPVSEDWTTMFLHTTGNQGILKVLVSYGLLPNRLPFWLNTIRLPFVFAVLLLIWKYARYHDDRQWSSLLAFALVVITMLICLPNVFYAYFILLLFPILVLAGYFWIRKQWAWLILLVVCAGSFIVDDQWVYGLAQASHLLEPTQEIMLEVQQLGVSGYLLKHHKLLTALWCYGLATPFMPYVFWVLAALALRDFSKCRLQPSV